MRQATIAWTVLVLMGGLAPSVPAADSNRALLQGVDLMRKGRKAEALDIFRRITAEDPSNLEAWNERAALEAASGDLNSARISLEKAFSARADIAALARNLEKVRSRQARLAYDSAFGTSSSLPPLQLDAAIDDRSVDRVREIDSLRTALVGALDEIRRSALLRDSLQRRDQELARLRASTQVASADTRPPASAPVSEPVQAPKPSKASPPKASPRPDVRPADPVAALKAWAKAWSRQDVDAYLGCYSSEFHPAGQSRQEWEDRRRDRIRAPKWILVDVGSPSVVVSRPDHAEIVYRQSYQTETGKLSSRKRISMELQDGAWKIVSESEAR